MNGLLNLLPQSPSILHIIYSLKSSITHSQKIKDKRANEILVFFQNQFSLYKPPEIFEPPMEFRLPFGNYFFSSLLNNFLALFIAYVEGYGQNTFFFLQLSPFSQVHVYKNLSLCLNFSNFTKISFAGFCSLSIYYLLSFTLLDNKCPLSLMTTIPLFLNIITVLFLLFFRKK